MRRNTGTRDAALPVRWVASRLTFANVVSLLALFVALGGASYAVTLAPPNSVNSRAIINGQVQTQDLARRAVNASRLSNNAVTTRVLAPNSVTSGQIANGQVTSADVAPSLTSSLKLHCPSGLTRAGDLCFEFNERSAATWPTALRTCSRAQLRLPDSGELALVFDHLGAPQDLQWTSTWFVNSGQAVAAQLRDNANRDLLPGNDTITTSWGYRCVTTASN